jgi:hypothetical protein
MVHTNNYKFDYYIVLFISKIYILILTCGINIYLIITNLIHIFVLIFIFFYFHIIFLFI